MLSSNRFALFGAVLLAAFVLLAPVLAAEPHPGDGLAGALSAGGWTRVTGAVNSWTKPVGDGWTMGVIGEDSVVMRVDWWKRCTEAEGQAEFRMMIARAGDSALHLTMLNSAAACAVQRRGDRWVAVIISVSVSRDSYILMRSEVLLEVEP